jgi:hypothetical protein
MVPLIHYKLMRNKSLSISPLMIIDSGSRLTILANG